jgi:two-component system osmolarity sensor histidine kinase EnvZ
MRRLWPDSLFTRTLLVQGLLVAAAVLIFSLVLIAERNVLLAKSHAALWAPVIRQAAAGTVGAPPVQAFDLADGVRRVQGPPSGLHWPITLMPGVRRLQTALTAYGVDLGVVWVSYDRGGFTYTGSMRIDNGVAVWLSTSGAEVLPSWSARMTLGLALLILLIAAISRYFVQRVTRPLARLHDRILSSANSGAELAPLAADDPWSPPPELRAMEQAYTQLAEKLQRNERERALLLAGVSHDLRSPLARIRLAAEMLPETSDNADGVAAVTRNVDLADRLISSFLEFVRAGTQKLDETVDAALVVRQAVAGFGRPQRELVAQGPERLLLHGASSLLLERLVVNLVDNALKHGGAPVQVHLACVGVTMELTVVDSGPGLPAGGAERLMEAFARGDASRGVPGFGLGLAIVQQIVTRLQGRLLFERSPIGHTVQVVLPLVR